MLYYIGQAIGVIAMIESFFIYQTKNRKTMVALKLLDDVLWVTHFLMIGGYSAALTTGIAVFREIVFYNKVDKKWANYIFWPIAFSVVFAACAIVEYQSIFGFLPPMASIASTWAFWQSDGRVAKLIQFPSVLCMFVYDIVERSYAGTITQIISIISIVLFFVREARSNRKR